ncbi:MAG: GNAT family N-acetyltransferase [Propionibacteriaceae bacterium]|nr:GNAT family N-acetyltransferase [Propionibacteriaceae bacterium]
MIQMKPFRELDAGEFFEIARLRELVFHLEQRITVADFDDLDRAEETLHWWVTEPGRCVAYARSVRLPAPEHGARLSFGRVAVHPGRRGEGLAAGLVAAIIAHHPDEPMVIHSQSDVVGLYERFGFRILGEEFMEAGIRHRSMIRQS